MQAVISQTFHKTTVFTIRMLVGPIPALVFFAAIITLIFYPISEKVYNEMMQKKES